MDISLSGSLGGPSIEFLVRETGSLNIVSTTALVDMNQYFYDLTFHDFAAGNTGQNQTLTVEQKFGTSLLGPGTYYFGIRWVDQFSPPYDNFLFTLDKTGAKSVLEITKVRQAADNRIMDIPSNMPYGTTGIKLVDFISGIQKKFNLVIYPDNTKANQFIVETWNNWYNKGVVRDFNKYINLDEKIEVIPANNFAVNKLTLGDALDQDYISQQFSKGANREYGKTYYVDTQNFFSQGEFNVKTTFASSPLNYLQGSGLSGSVGGITPPTPTQFLVGTCKFGYSYSAPDTCFSAASFAAYTLTGTLYIGAIVYDDEYGTSPVTGLRFIVGPSGGTIWNLDTSTGEILSETGYYC